MLTKEEEEMLFDVADCLHSARRYSETAESSESELTDALIKLTRLVQSVRRRINNNNTERKEESHG